MRAERTLAGAACIDVATATQKERQMRRLAVLPLAAATIVLAGCPKLTVTPQLAPSPQGPPKLIWAGNSAGYAIRWTNIDISAVPLRKSGGQVLTELGLTIFDLHRASRMQTGDCDFVRVARLQSVVGPIISIADDDTMKCANGATGAYRKTVAIDLRHPGTPALLSDYFPAHELGSLALRVARVCPSRPENLLNGFAFDQLQGSAVTVAVALPSACSEPAVKIALNVPPSLRDALELAARKRQGFLLKDQPAVSTGQTTTINYHYRVGNPSLNM
jgi:hypothetical protein